MNEQMGKLINEISNNQQLLDEKGERYPEILRILGPGLIALLNEIARDEYFISITKKPKKLSDLW